MPVTATRLHISKRKRLLMLDSQAWPERTAPGTTSVALLVTAFSGEHLANLPALQAAAPPRRGVDRHQPRLRPNGRRSCHPQVHRPCLAARRGLLLPAADARGGITETRPGSVVRPIRQQASVEWAIRPIQTRGLTSEYGARCRPSGRDRAWTQQCPARTTGAAGRCAYRAGPSTYLARACSTTASASRVWDICWACRRSRRVAQRLRSSVTRATMRVCSAMDGKATTNRLILPTLKL